MNILSLISAISAPNDLWTIIINWIQGAIGNFGWTIIIFTLLVKLITSPFDFVSKYTTRKQTLVQKKYAPQVAKLKKKFGKDEQQLKIQTNALYKRDGVKTGLGCVIMLVNMIITMVIFFTLYDSLKKVSSYETIHQYKQLEQTYSDNFYNSVINSSSTDDIKTKDDAEDWFIDIQSAKLYIDTTEDKTTATYASNLKKYTDGEPILTKATENASAAVVKKWNSIKSTWLWIDNIFVEDATTHPFPSYEALKKLASNAGTYYSDYVKNNINEESYTAISNIVHNDTTRDYNGYYILAILAGVVTYLSQFITDRHNKLKNKKANNLAKLSEQQTGAKTMQIMKFILPIIMIMFTITTTASFGIYILASNIASILIGEIITIIVDKLTKKQRLEVEEVLEKEANRMIKKGQLKE